MNRRMSAFLSLFGPIRPTVVYMPQKSNKRRDIKSHKKNVKRVFPLAFCKRLSDCSGYIIWEGKIKPRGFETPALGIGKNSVEAWKNAYQNIWDEAKKSNS